MLQQSSRTVPHVAWAIMHTAVRIRSLFTVCRQQSTSQHWHAWTFCAYDDSSVYTSVLY